MSRALLPNLTFEYEIADREPPAPARRQCDRWKYILRLVPGFESACTVDELDEEPTAIAAWGHSRQARAAAGAAGAQWPAPDVVREANDKRFSHRLEQELGLGLPGAVLVSSVEELERAAADVGAWIAKHPFGVSGRERVSGQGEPTPQERKAAQRLLRTTSSLVFEPRVQLEEEWSIHYEIHGRREVEYIGATGLLTDQNGVFRGNVAPVDDVPVAIVAVTEEVARRLSERDYTGSLGIDAFVGKLNEGRILRPLVEINARMSFGRLALHLSARANGAEVVWHHPARPRPAELAPFDPDAPRSGRWRLPEWCDPEGRSGTWIEFLSDPNLGR